MNIFAVSCERKRSICPLAQKMSEVTPTIEAASGQSAKCKVKSAKLRWLFAPQKASLIFCASKIFHISRSEIYHCAVRRNITQPKAEYHSPIGRISLKTLRVFSASFRSRGALFRAATSESRRFSAEKRRLMLAPNRFIRD